MQRKQIAKAKHTEHDMSEDNESFHDDRPFRKLFLTQDEITEELKKAKICLS